jgi:integrase/recombinase XerD
MSLLAPTLQAFFTDRLLTQRQASPRTVAAYRDTLRLLLGFVQQRTATPPCRLDLADLDAELVAAFLTHLEHQRGNSVRTRNARLAAIHSLFRFAALRHPEHAELIQRVLAIPAKRYDRTLLCFLTPAETDALLAAPDRSAWHGRRDHALLVLALQTGLRVSELTSLTTTDLHLDQGPHVTCHGKGRKQRATPLTPQTVTVLRTWTREQATTAADPVFPTRGGHPLSVDAIQWLLAKHVRTAAQDCPSLHTKHVTPHTLRHTCAVNLLRAGVDTATIALWLGHADIRATQTYLHADLALKERALARTTPPNVPPGRYRPPDPLLAFLEQL